MLFCKNNILQHFLILYFVFFIASAEAQEIQKKSNRFQIGITSSIRASTLIVITEPLPAGIIASDQSYQKIPKLGYKAGGTVKLNLSPHFFLMSGLSYLKDKTKVSRDLLPGSSDAKISIEERYSWFEMPVTVNYIVNPKSSKKIFVGLGLSARRLISAKRKITTTIANTTYYDPEFSIYSSVNNWNMFGIGHVGVELPVWDKNKFLITISFERNLLKMVHQIYNTNPNFDYSFVQSDFKINSFSLNVSYLFE